MREQRQKERTKKLYVNGFELRKVSRGGGNGKSTYVVTLARGRTVRGSFSKCASAAHNN